MVEHRPFKPVAVGSSPTPLTKPGSREKGIGNTKKTNTVREGVPGYRSLSVWQKAHRATILTLELVEQLPRTSSTARIVDQLVGSVSSIGANIAEGYPAREGAEYTRYLNIALRSAYETDNWLQLLKDSAVIARRISREKVE